MPELLYQNLVEAAAERAAETGAVDLIDIAHAAECGFSVDTFTADVAKRAGL